MKILIVDDNAEMRKTLKKVVLREGDEAVECGYGARATGMYRKHRPDLVLMDISMKGMNGIEATEHILAYDPDARVIIVTDYTDRQFQQAAWKAGARAFFPKENIRSIRDAVDADFQSDSPYLRP